MKKIIFLWLGMLIPSLAFGQYQYPSSTRFVEIKTPRFKVICPDSIQSKGIMVANMLEASADGVSRGLNTRPTRVPVLLYNQSVMSNGFMALGPRRMGIFTTPPQNALMVGGTDWLQTLSLHEYRHTSQFDKLDDNLTSFFGQLFGDAGKGILMFWSVPYWVYEGDAIYSETVNSLGGRGRMPSFTRDIRAIEAQGTRFKYSKAYLGSYKHYYPDHYHLGYLLTSHVIHHHGEEAWEQAFTRSSRYSLSPYAFTRSVKRFTGSSVRRTYRACMDSIRETELSRIATIEETGMESVSRFSSRVWTNYMYPCPVDGGKVVALKHGLANVPTLVAIDSTGHETFLRGIAPLDRVHARGRWVTWSTERPHYRFSAKSYAEIMLYDLENGTSRKLSSRTRFFAPSVSPDQTRIAAVEYGEGLECALVVLDIETGNIVNRYKMPWNTLARYPDWSADDNEIVYTLTSGQQVKIQVINTVSGEVQDITAYSTESITHPVLLDNQVLFNSSISGNDMVHAVDRVTGDRWVVARSRFGVYNARVDDAGENVYFQNYTTAGHEIASTPLNRDTWIKDTGAKDFQPPYYYFNDRQTKVDLPDSAMLVDTGTVQVKKYYPILHSINPHTWAPYPVNNGVGFSVVSDNLLHTSAFLAGINYFPKDKATRYFIEYRYSRFLPVLKAHASYGRNSEPGNTIGLTLDYNEKQLGGGVEVPLDFSMGNFLTKFTVGANYHYFQNEYLDDYYVTPFEHNKPVTLAEGFTSFSSYRAKAPRDIDYRYGLESSFNYWLAGASANGLRAITRVKLYAPGLFRHHSIGLEGGLQQNSAGFRYGGIYSLTSDMERPRGYDNYVYDSMTKGLATYTFPVLYPDFALGSFLYIKRVSASAFYDHALLKHSGRGFTLNSAGGEVNFECNFFRFLPSVKLGVRYSHRLFDSKDVLEFVLMGTAF